MGKIRRIHLHDISANILKNNGVSPQDASIIADSIVYAHTRGKHTHGIGRLPIYLRKIKQGLMNPATPMTCIRKTNVISLRDAENGFGQVAAIKAMDECIDKARIYGIGIVGVRDSNNFGTAGFIGEYAARNGMIGIILANSGPAIAPTGGNKTIFGTNPICVSFPMPEDQYPIVFDMACSNAARGKIRLAAKNGEKIPLGWAVDQDGKETDDPNKALSGAMIPIGGYKGYGIAMCVDILAGMLTGSGFAGTVKNLNHPTDKSRYGHFIAALDPSAFMDISTYENDIETLIANLRSCGQEGLVHYPGEMSGEIAKKQGEEIEIKDNLLSDFYKLAEENGVNV